MKPAIRVERDREGTYTVYLVDPAHPHQALHHVPGVHTDLSDRDVGELRWAAQRCDASERDVLRDVRAALRTAKR